MNTKDLLIITTVALGTATLTVATFLGDTLNAANEANSPTPQIAQSELVAHGIKMTLTASGHRQFKSGDVPSFDLLAVNTLGQSSETHVRLAMTATAPSSALSRMVSFPAQIWQADRLLTLAANETKTFTFMANTNLPANSIISVSIEDADFAKTANAKVVNAGVGPTLRPPSSLQRGIVALRFSTRSLSATPDVALASPLAPRH